MKNKRILVLVLILIFINAKITSFQIGRNIFEPGIIRIHFHSDFFKSGEYIEFLHFYKLYTYRTDFINDNTYIEVAVKIGTEFEWIEKLKSEDCIKDVDIKILHRMVLFYSVEHTMEMKNPKQQKQVKRYQQNNKNEARSVLEDSFNQNINCEISHTSLYRAVKNYYKDKTKNGEEDICGEQYGNFLIIYIKNLHGLVIKGHNFREKIKMYFCIKEKIDGTELSGIMIGEYAENSKQPYLPLNAYDSMDKKYDRDLLEHLKYLFTKIKDYHTKDEDKE